MAEKLFENTEDPIETAVKMALLEDKIETAQKDLERTKKQLQDAETARERAENARKYCLEEAGRHAAEDRATIDLLEKKVKVLRVHKRKAPRDAKSFRCVAINALPQSPEPATRSAAFSNTRSDQCQLYLLSYRHSIHLHHYSTHAYHESSTRSLNFVSLDYRPSCPNQPGRCQDHRWPARRERASSEVGRGSLQAD